MLSWWRTHDSKQFPLAQKHVTLARQTQVFCARVVNVSQGNALACFSSNEPMTPKRKTQSFYDIRINDTWILLRGWHYYYFFILVCQYGAIQLTLLQLILVSSFRSKLKLYLCYPGSRYVNPSLVAQLIFRLNAVAYFRKKCATKMQDFPLFFPASVKNSLVWMVLHGNWSLTRWNRLTGSKLWQPITVRAGVT